MILPLGHDRPAPGGDRRKTTGCVIWLVGRKIPTMIDNAYRHLNKADNLRSLRRARA